jgi:glucokinase
MITLGTGIGGSLILGGTLLRGHNGMAGEFGHMQVVPGGRDCECGGTGCWEQYCSGNALVRFARARLADDAQEAHGARVTALTDLCGGDPAALTGPLVTDAARRGDAVALAAFASVGHWLGVGVANLVAAFDPELVVVGGGVSAADGLLLDPAREALAESLVGAGHREIPPVQQARFGPEAGIVGAADLARTEGVRPMFRRRRGELVRRARRRERLQRFRELVTPEPPPTAARRRPRGRRGPSAS